MAGLRRIVGSVLDTCDPDDRVRKFRDRLADEWDPKNRYLRSCRGVVHVGANVGQERDLYRSYKLNVLWIEPIPEIFGTLSKNIEGYRNQRAVQALITDKDDEVHTLNIASNGGASSSILKFQDHADIWPDVTYCGEIEVVSATLDAVMSSFGPDYDALVLDTQGTELLVLKGAVRTLQSMQSVMVEAADFEAYAGCATVAEIEQFMGSQGFQATRRDLMASRAGGGSYFNVLFTKAPQAAAR